VGRKPVSARPDSRHRAASRRRHRATRATDTHARRARILPERHRPRVLATSMPRSVPTSLVDGQVAGTWERVGGQVVTTPFGQLTGAAAAEVRAEAERFAAFCAEADAGR
jgi:hypothetical protein